MIPVLRNAVLIPRFVEYGVSWIQNLGYPNWVHADNKPLGIMLPLQQKAENNNLYEEAMTSSRSILSDLASFFSISSSPPPPEIPEKSNTNNENECIEIAMTNDVPTTPNNISPINSNNTTTATNMSNGTSVEEGVSVVRHTTPSIEISQGCYGAYDMSKIKIDYISQPTTTASDSWEEEDNTNNVGLNPTSSKRREIVDYLQSKFSMIDKRRRILLVHLLMLLVIGLVLVIVIVATTSVSVKSKDQRQSSSGKFMYTCFHMLCF